MKTTLGITIISVILFFASSCTKDSNLAPTTNSVIQERAGGSTKFINVILMSDLAYASNDETYPEGHILEFHNSDWVSMKPTNATKIQNALAFMKNAVLTGDTTGQYLNLFTYIIPDASFMDTYAEPALKNGPNYPAFKSWFQSTVTNWMNANDCKHVVSNTVSTQYYLKIRCGAN